MIIFDYLRSFFSHYNGIGKFALSLLYEAHESSMRVARTIDKDLAIYLNETLSDSNAFKRKKDGEDLPPVTFIAADHGMHYGRYSSKSQPGKLEHKMPLLLIYVPNWYLELYPEIEQNLKQNEQRLFSAYDLHYTIKHFMTYPEKPPTPMAPNEGSNQLICLYLLSSHVLFNLSRG